MGVGILYGESVHALADACFDGIRDYLGASPQGRAILLVPETSKVEIEQAYLEHTGSPGIMRLEILSFSRFCHRVLGEIGRVSDDIIDDTGKSMLVYRALRESEGELLLFRGLCTDPRFVSGVIAVMGEMSRALVGHEELAEKAAEIPDPVTARKTRELSMILRGYESGLRKAGLRDPQERYTEAAGYLKAAAGLSRTGSLRWPHDRLCGILGSRIWVLGFGVTRDFTPQEYAILDVLQGCTEILIAIAGGRSEPGDGPGADSGGIFRGGMLCREGIARRWDVGSERYVPPARPALFSHLGNCFISRQETVYEGGTGGGRDPEGEIAFLRAPGRREEIRLIAGEIRSLVLQGKARYRDIAVMAAQAQAYRPVIRSVFEDAGIPFYIDEKKSLLDTALGRAVTAALNIVSGGWDIPQVMAFLRSGFAGADRDEIDAFENFLLAQGIRYRSRIFDDGCYLAGGEPQPRMTALRDRTLGAVAAFEKSIAGCRTAGGFCGALLELVRGERYEEKTSAVSEGLMAQGLPDPAVAAVKAWNALLGLLEQTRQIAADTAMDFRAFRSMVISGMEKAVSGTIPYSIDSVRFSAIRQSAGKQPAVLFVAGLGAEDYPERAPDEGLLNDRDRALLSECLDIRIPSVASGKVYEDLYHSYMILTCASGKLYLSCPAPEGGESQIMRFAAKASGRSAAEYRADPAPDSPQICSVNEALYALSRRMPAALGATGGGEREESSMDARWEALERLFDGMPEVHGRLEEIRNVRRRAARSIRLPDRMISAAYRDRPEMSVSQLETYAACSFSHYAEYLLKLRPRDKREIRPAETGSVLHGIIELAVRGFLDEYRAADSDTGRRAILEKYARMDHEEASVAFLRETARRDGFGMFLDPGRFAAMGRPSARLASAMLRQIFRNCETDPMLPEKIEWEFSVRNGNALEILPGTSSPVYFRGKADRIDGSGDLFRIVDYKSGAKKVDFDQWYHGLSLQLPAYVAAFRRSEPGRVPADAGYLQFARPIIETAKAPS